MFSKISSFFSRSIDPRLLLMTEALNSHLRVLALRSTTAEKTQCFDFNIHVRFRRIISVLTHYRFVTLWVQEKIFFRITRTIIVHAIRQLASSQGLFSKDLFYVSPSQLTRIFTGGVGAHFSYFFNVNWYSRIKFKNLKKKSTEKTLLELCTRTFCMRIAKKKKIFW